MEYNEEIEQIRKLKRSWMTKKTNLGLREVNTSDPSTLLNIQEEIKNCEIKIEQCDDDIKELLKEDSIKDFKEDSDEELTNEELLSALSALKIETQRLGYNSTNENLEKIHTLKGKIYNQLFGDIDKEIEFVSSNIELVLSSALFNTIYSTEELDSLTIAEIQKIRTSTDSYQWYDRSLIVSALALSLLNFKFDKNKASVLLDFISDFEEKVWQRALVGLVIAIVNQPNRSWMRAQHFIERLKKFQHVELIQNGLKAINYILQNELFKYSLIKPQIFKLEMFTKPLSYFVPFYPENRLFKDAVDEAKTDIDVDEFKNYLDNMPFLDSHKYGLCFALKSNGLSKRKLESAEQKALKDCFLVHEIFYPFQSIISEYYCFFSFFEEKLIHDVFQKKQSLLDTDLKKIVLDLKMKLLIEANALYNDDNYGSAILKYEDVLKLDHNLEEAKWKLACSYQKKDEHVKALELFKTIEKDRKPDDKSDVWYEIGYCLNAIDQFTESLEFCDKIPMKDENITFGLLTLKAENYIALKEKDKSIEFLASAIEIADDGYEFNYISALYRDVEEYSLAIECNNKAMELDPNSDKIHRTRSTIFGAQKIWDEALIAIKKAVELKPKSKHNNLDYARVLVFSGENNFKEAMTIFKTLLKSSYADLAYGNLGHLGLLDNRIDDAFDCYMHCLQKLSDVKDFETKMERDRQFICALGISEDDYSDIIKRVVVAYQV